MNFRELIQQFHHAVVVLERVQTHPRQAVFTRYQILVERLVLMPKKDDAKRRHGWTASLACGIKRQERSRGCRFFTQLKSGARVALLPLNYPIVREDSRQPSG